MGLTANELIVHPTKNKSRHMSFFLPKMLSLFVKPTRLRAEEILQNHTIFPYATAFASRATVLAYQEAILTKATVRSTAALVQNLAINASRYVFCPACVGDDTKHYGESYWHRMHFLPGISTCPRHFCALLTLPSTLHAGLRPRAGPTHEDVKKALPTVALSEHSDFLNVFAQRSLATINRSWQHRNDWISTYRSLAIKKGYVMKNGAIAGSQLALNLQNFLGQRTLDAFGCSFPKKTSVSWPANMVRAYTTGQALYSPLRHLLLYAFLE